MYMWMLHYSVWMHPNVLAMLLMRQLQELPFHSQAIGKHDIMGGGTRCAGEIGVVKMFIDADQAASASLTAQPQFDLCNAGKSIVERLVFADASPGYEPASAGRGIVPQTEQHRSLRIFDNQVNGNQWRVRHNGSEGLLRERKIRWVAGETD